jgi:hypothetical protein
LIKNGKYMTTAWSQSYRPVIILIIVIGLFTGCASVFQDFEDRMHRKRFKSEYASLDDAMSAYKDGKYVEALGLFKTLSTAGTHEKLARKAWMGEICCLLILADTQSDYAAAIDLWRNVRKSAPQNDDAWNLALIDPLVVRMTPRTTTRVIEIYPPAAQVSKETKAPAGQARDDKQQDDLRLKTELAALRKKAADADQLQSELETVVAENRSLKEKIKALEAIDQNIRKKKTEIAAPSE